MFKVGDLVRCIERPHKDHYQIEPDSIFEITEFAHSSNFIRRAMHLRSKPEECFSIEYFELLNYTPYGVAYPLGEAPQ